MHHPCKTLFLLAQAAVVLLVLGLSPGALGADAPSIDTPYRVQAQAPLDAAVVVGVERYLRLPPVPYAGRDAQVFYDFLLHTRGVPADRVQLLTGDASRERIVQALTDLGKRVGPDGMAWVYFAGHGAATLDTGEPLLLGDDVAATPESFAQRGVPLAEITRLAGTGGGQVLVVVDACFGGVGRTREPLVANGRFAVPTYASRPDRSAVWMAAGPNEASMSADALKHGIFTFLAVGALRGWADGEGGPRDGKVTAEEAQRYLQRALAAAQVTDQHPTLLAQQPDAWILSGSVSEKAPPITAALLAPTRPSDRVKTGVAIDYGAGIVNKVVDDKGFLVVKATPPEATLWINGEQVGQGYVQMEKMVGHYVVVAELGLYHPERQPLDLTPAGARVTLELKPAFGTLVVRSEPQGAEVWVDGEQVGKTPWKSDRKPSGAHEVKIVHPGFLTRTETVLVEDGKEAILQGPLVYNRGDLEVVTDPPGARIFVDNQDTGRSTPATLKDLEVGTREVRLVKEAYTDAVKAPMVERGANSRVEVALVARTGMLSVLATGQDGQPCEGEVRIDGEPRGLTPLKLELPVRTYTVDVRCGDLRATTTARVPFNEVERVVVQTRPWASRVNWPRTLGLTTLGLGVGAGGSAAVSLWARNGYLSTPDADERERLGHVSNTAAGVTYGLGAAMALTGAGAVATWVW